MSIRQLKGGKKKTLEESTHQMLTRDPSSSRQRTSRLYSIQARKECPLESLGSSHLYSPGPLLDEFYEYVR